MKTMQATDAKNRFGELLEDAISEPVLIQKNGRDVAVVMSKVEFDLHYRKQSKKELIERCHEESIERFCRRRAGFRHRPPRSGQFHQGRAGAVVEGQCGPVLKVIDFKDVNAR